ncbi:MAG: iron-sulfur cluster assembly accessory protein [Chloroflexota bacterium]|nr:iron-sulfur cluster assembly accessory protein [Chloroflexota bacterium]MDE3193615.1 iron-sulfur cluster assembly accessory protein [Chloroflexota bacterium]
MIELTDTAQAKLLEVRQEAPTRPVLRVYVAGRTCSGYQYGLALDEAAAADDATFEQGGIRVAIDPLSLEYVDGARIDYVETSEGSGFVVTNERWSSEGGCGGGCSCGHG